MYKLIIDNIINGENIRENLIELKKLIAIAKNKRELAYYLEGDYKLFIRLLDNSDAKVRRNAAIILGEMEDDELIEPIFKAYLKEETLFIRADYLKALMNYDYSAYIDDIKSSLKEAVANRNKESESAKHYDEEIRILRALLYNSDSCVHTFTGKNMRTQLYLTSYPGCTDILIEKIKSIGKRFAILGAGLMVYDITVAEIENIRVYKDFYFSIIEDAPYIGTLEAAKSIVGSGLVALLRDIFSGTAPFTYRLQIKSFSDIDYTNQVKEVIVYIDDSLPNDLVNTPSDYQLEIKLVVKKNGNFSVFLKPCIIRDNRFSYRVNSTSESMKPVLAASISQYLSKYIKHNSAVLDPFCGSGILLIERAKISDFSRALGIDILDLAISSARSNFAAAGIKAGTICKNFFNIDSDIDFLADEVITDLPRVSSKRNEAYIKKLYRIFLLKIREFIKKDGFLFLYTNLPEGILDALKEMDFYTLIEQRLLRKKDNSTLFVIKY